MKETASPALGGPYQSDDNPGAQGPLLQNPLTSYLPSMFSKAVLLLLLSSRELTKVRLVKTMVFPVVMYGCESWTVKKAERRRIDAFELWC